MKFPVEAGSMDSKNYLRLKDKESAKGLFVGDPYHFRMHWVQNKSVLCSEDNQCPHCNQGLKSSFRFRISFITKDGDDYVAKIFEQGWTVYETLQHLNADYDLEKHLVKISRSGSGPSDTSYTILPVPNGELTPELAKKLAAVPLHDLRHKLDAEKTTTKRNNFTPEPAFNSDEEIPF